MAKRKPVDFRALRILIPPYRALRLLGWQGRWEPAGQYRGPCPIHGSSRPGSRSFTVGERVAYCHKCKWKGDAVALWAAIHSLTMIDAAYDLCERSGVAVPPLG